jgi:hypothetical protein
MLSSDTLQPWKRVQETVIWTARKFKQIYILVWYPHRFGAEEAGATHTERHKYQNIIQMVVPTRTGLDGLRSTAAVWLTAHNDTAPTIKPRMVRYTESELQTDDVVVSVENF